MKQYKLLTVVVLCVCLFSSALADAVASPAFVNIRITRASLSISGSTATCTGGVWAYSSDSFCEATIKLQKELPTGWVTIRTFYTSGYGSASGSNTYSVTTGTYRSVAAGNVSGESFQINSPTKTKE